MKSSISHEGLRSAAGKRAIVSFAAMVGAIGCFARKAPVDVAMRSPETSSIFKRHVDRASGVTSYVLEPGRFAHNQ